MQKPKVIILGGHGTFGSLITDQLVESANVVIVGRNHIEGQKYAKTVGAHFIQCDITDKVALRKIFNGLELID